MSQTAAAPKAIQDALSQAFVLMLGDAEKRIADSVTKTIDDTLTKHTETTTEVIFNFVEDQIKARIQPAVPMEIKINELPAVKLEQPPAKILPELLKLASARIPAFIKGPSGSGKTTAVRQVAKVLGLPFASLVGSPDMTKSDVWGRQTATGFVESALTQVLKHGGVFLIDEAGAMAAQVALQFNNVADDSTTVLNPITQEVITKHKDFILFAACNTWGKGGDHVYTGRERQDGSLLGRFKPIEYDYCQDLERAIAKQYTSDLDLVQTLWNARAKLKDLGSDENISTRLLERCLKLQSLGFDDAYVFESITLTWPDGLAEQAGLVAKKPKAKK